MRAPALATTALLACLALVGCESDPVGPVDPDDTATPSQPPTTPTPTGPTPPVLPEAAKANTAQGAAEFVKYYVSLMNYSAQTGDTDDIRSFSRSCQLCAGYIGVYERLKRDGGQSGDPGWSASVTLSDRVEERFTVLADIDTQEYKYRESRDGPTQTAPATQYKLIFTVDRQGSSPNVAAIDEQMVSP